MLDSTAQKANFYYSLKKYIIDNLYTIQGIPVIFDTFLPPDFSIERWISVHQKSLDRDTLSSYQVELYCITRNDYEGEKLTELVDIVAGYFIGDITQTDGLRRIPFYDATTELQNGNMIVTNASEGEHLQAPDESKFLILTFTLRMASKI